MTILRVDLCGEELSTPQKEKLSVELIEAFANVEVGHDSAAIRQGFVVQFGRLDTSDLWLGGRPMVEAGESGKAALISAHVMAGPWNTEMKRELFERIERLVREAARMPRSGTGSDIWMTLVEVPEGGWGLGGRAVSIGSLAPVFSEDRQARIRSYLAERG